MPGNRWAGRQIDDTITYQELKRALGTEVSLSVPWLGPSLHPSIEKLGEVFP